MTEKTCDNCNIVKLSYDFHLDHTECKFCEVFKCSTCSTTKPFLDFSLNQIQKREGGGQFKCKQCTGQSVAPTLTCSECDRTKNLSCFKKSARAPPVCNDCRLQNECEVVPAHDEWDAMIAFEEGGGEGPVFRGYI
jgi:hypothetical protein